MPFVKESEESYRENCGDGKSLLITMGASDAGERQWAVEIYLNENRTYKAKYEPKSHNFEVEPPGSRALLDLEGVIDWIGLPDVFHIGLLGVLQANSIDSPKKD